MGEIRWDKMAEGLGAHGELVDSVADLAPALMRAKAYDGPSLLCVRTSKVANLAMPQSICGRFSEVYLGPLHDRLTLVIAVCTRE
jgi:acetolactate synthase-1/2/3 large subunit